MLPIGSNQCSWKKSSYSKLKPMSAPPIQVVQRSVFVPTVFVTFQSKRASGWVPCIFDQTSRAFCSLTYSASDASNSPASAKELFDLE